jgi:threonine dehydrogenase-like Zn-dependent dehydrogenase
VSRRSYLWGAGAVGLVGVVAWALHYSEINLWASQVNPQTIDFYKSLATVLVAVTAALIAGSIQCGNGKLRKMQ